MPNEPVSSDVVTPPEPDLTSAPSVKANPLTAIVPSGTTALSGYTFNTPGVNWFYPFLPQQQLGLVVSGGISTISGIAQTGWASVNQAGFVFQNGQYNTTQRGF